MENINLMISITCTVLYNNYISKLLFLFLLDVSKDLKKLIDVDDPEGAFIDESEFGLAQSPNQSIGLPQSPNQSIGLSREKRKSDKLTAYACEDSRLNIR